MRKKIVFLFWADHHLQPIPSHVAIVAIQNEKNQYLHFLYLFYILQLWIIPGMEGGVRRIKGGISARGKLDQPFNSFSDRPIYLPKNCKDWKYTNQRGEKSFAKSQ